MFTSAIKYTPRGSSFKPTEIGKKIQKESEIGGGIKYKIIVQFRNSYGTPVATDKHLAFCSFFIDFDVQFYNLQVYII